MAEIFGGRVEAFSQYETGKARPSLALVKLLKVLDRHPDLLNEVRGQLIEAFSITVQGGFYSRYGWVAFAIQPARLLHRLSSKRKSLALRCSMTNMLITGGGSQRFSCICTAWNRCDHGGQW